MVASSVYTHETESNHVPFEMVAPTFVVYPPALLLTSIEKKKIVRQERTPTTLTQGDFRFYEY